MLALTNVQIVYDNTIEAVREVSLTPVGSSSEQFRQFLAADAQAWGQVVRDNGIRLD